MKTKKILVIPVMVLLYLITLLAVIIGSPIWAFAILREPDNSTQSNALGRL